jgi:glycerophosphoryl diester phosphodiesterase
MPLSPFALIDDWLAPPPEPGKVAWIDKFTYAHRGLHGPGVPENSPAAFAAAIERGFGIECDIQRSRDSQPMVFHDWELDRLTGETGQVASRSAAQLAGIALAGSTEHLPSLRRLLDQVAGRVPVLIEVKSRRELPVRALCRAIRDQFVGYYGPHAVMSFDPRISRWFADRSPSTVRGLVMTEEGSRDLAGSFRRRLALWHARPDFLAYDIRDLPGSFPAGQRVRGLPLVTWTVCNQELLRRARDHADAPVAEGAGIGATDE